MRDKTLTLLLESGVDVWETFSWLVRELESKGPHTVETVIYCKSLVDSARLDVFKVLGDKSVYPVGAADISKNRLVDMYHSETDSKIKQHITNFLNDPSSVLRIVIATSALGMAVDFKDTFAYSFPWSTDAGSFLQR